MFLAGAIQVQGTGGLGVNNTGYIFWLNSTTFHNRSDGVLTLSNYAENDFGRLQFGGTTSSFPALKRNSTTLAVRLADDSADAPLTAAAITTSGNLTFSADVILARDNSNILALRNGANAQTFRVYGTYNGTNDEWIQLDHGVTSANTATILSTKTGSGVARAIEMQVGTARKIRFGTTGGWELFNGATREGYFNWDAFTVRSDAFVGFASSTTVPSGQGDTNLIRVGAAIMGIRGGNTTTGGALSFIEQTAPVAPAANGVYIYAEDNGSGKTRLMALFATGAAQQIAIEP
jgi:hypothetical protein